ncbi:MAG TPA: c-type cytochrome, partial [Gemmataceae bacterium]|nr:c-type cytochrome [Gemmataceae bacterium]
ADRALVNPKDVPEPALRRMLAANYRLGGKKNAQALVMAATRSDVPVSLREESLKWLQTWEKPSGRDVIVGLWRPMSPRPGADVAEALRPALASLMTGPDKIRTEGAKLAAKHGMKEIGPALRDLVKDKKRAAGVRIEALKALETLKDANLEMVAKAAMSDADARVRTQGRRIVLLKAPKAEAVDALKTTLESGAVVERQGALHLLADLKTPEGDKLLGHWVDELVTKKAPPEISLDILLAAKSSKDPAIAKKLAAYEATRDLKNPMSVYRESLVGGDADNGRRVFLEKSELSCVRCHKLNGVGGEVGPDLTHVAKVQKRDYLLESIVDPNKQIAKGFESVVIMTQTGLTHTGILKSEDAKSVRIMTAEGQLLTIPKTEIDERSRGPSAMPSDLATKMSRTELRDLVEFLSSLK